MKTEDSEPKNKRSKFDESKVKRDGDGQFARTASRGSKEDEGDLKGLKLNPQDAIDLASQGRIDVSEAKRLKALEPKTAAGYRKMFNKVPDAEWGGADVSISHRMPDGRRVWLYGDTLSKNNGFVHSTGIVQSGDKLHVSKGGKQLLPNGGKDPKDPKRDLIHWIDGVKQGPTPNTLIVSSMQMSVGKAGPWDFKKTRESQSKQAVVRVDKTGNMTFVKWKGWAPTPQKNNPHVANDLAIAGPNHYTYGRVTHDIKLADGSRLTTTSQNWDNDFSEHMNPDGSFRYRDWRPIFGSSAGKELRMSTDLDNFLEHYGVKGMKWGVSKGGSSSSSSPTRRPVSPTTKHFAKELGFGSIAPAAMIMGLGPPLSIALGISVGVLRSPPVANAIKQSSKASAELMRDIGSTKMSVIRESKESQKKLKVAAAGLSASAAATAAAALQNAN